MPSVKGFSKSRIFIAMGAWLVLVGSLLAWMEIDSRNEERRLAFKAANVFFQHIILNLSWNASHGGVYVPVAEQSQPTQWVTANDHDIATDNGMKLTKLNPAYMTWQLGELAKKTPDGIQFHLASLNPIRPENSPSDWERAWLLSFEKGAKEQGDFFVDGATTWFRYMAPVAVNRTCVLCHSQNGVTEDVLYGGVSVSIPYPTHTHTTLFAGFGLVAAIGLAGIFFIGLFYEREKFLFEAIFNGTVPTCVTDTEYRILLANESYWAEFGRMEGNTALKCYEHRHGGACHTANCPLNCIKDGASICVCEPSKEKNGVTHHYMVVAKPLLDARNKVIGIVESFQDITTRKTLEQEKEQLITELQTSLDRVKVLSGLIPICASCKQIRDDQGYWSQVESYISRHSAAKFSHGICPACVKKLYPEFSDEILGNANTAAKGK